MSCLFNRSGHTWRRIEDAADDSLRACRDCGAAGRTLRRGGVELLWEPRKCPVVTRTVETPLALLYYSCHRPEGHRGDHDETYPTQHPAPKPLTRHRT